MKRLLFVGTYSTRGSRGLYACEADSETGALAPLAEPMLAEPAVNPTFLAVRNGWLYASGELGDAASPRTGGVAAFRIRGRNGALERAGSVPCGKGAPCHVLVFDGGRRLAAAQYTAGELHIIAVHPDGSLKGVERVFKNEGSGPMKSRQDGPHVHSACASPDGRTLFSPDLGTDRVNAYRIEPGALVPLEPLICPPGSGPRHMTLSADGRFLWVAGELDSTVTGFRKEGDAYKPFGHWPLLPPDFTGESWAAEIRLHPNGRWLYATNRGMDDVVSMDVQADGTPRITGRAKTGAWPRGMILSPDGRFAYVGAQHADRIDVYAIDPVTGVPVKCGGLDGIPSPVGFAFAE